LIFCQGFEYAAKDPFLDPSLEATVAGLVGKVAFWEILPGRSGAHHYAAERGKRHKNITEWAWQLLLVLRRWHPQREIVAVADRAYAPRSLP
jgi:hypothetical protein